MLANESKKYLNFLDCFGRYANFSYICKNKNINQIMEKKLTLSMLLVSIMFCFSGCNSEIKKGRVASRSDVGFACYSQI